VTLIKFPGLPRQEKFEDTKNDNQKTYPEEGKTK